MHFNISEREDIRHHLSLPRSTAQDLTEVVTLALSHRLYEDRVWTEAVTQCRSVEEIEALVLRDIGGQQHGTTVSIQTHKVAGDEQRVATTIQS
jgi:hypothetical protein